MKNFNAIKTILKDFLGLILITRIISLFSSSSILRESIQISTLTGLVLITVFYSQGLYNRKPKFFSISELKLIFISTFVISLIKSLIFIKNGNPFENTLIGETILLLSVLPHRIFSKTNLTNKKNAENAIIIGVNDSAIFLKRALYNNSSIKVIGFCDPKGAQEGIFIDGVKVYNIHDDLVEFVRERNVGKIIFTEIDLAQDLKELILSKVHNNTIEFLYLPKEILLTEKEINSSDLNYLKVEDLLSRNEIEIDLKGNFKFYKDTTILITGAAGSIGSELVKQLVNFNPKKIVGIDFNEFALYNLENEIKNSNVEFLLVNALDRIQLKNLFESYNFNFVFNASAYKHVPILEKNPFIGLKNNILATYYLGTEASKKNVSKFILVSSDKAVNPTNVMGASKRLCELLINSALFKKSNTHFITTRFGNVIGSNGSVIPTFQKQIAKGGPVTVTHKEITRYFMTIPEASKLVIEACRIGEDGMIYIFDMGKPVKIYELAQNMIKLSKKTLSEIPIEITGLRPGEKLYEELLLSNEDVIKSDNKHIFIGKQLKISESRFKEILKLIKDLELGEIENDIKIISKRIKKILPEFNHK